ncbi:MAG: hypothetical protein V2A71_06030 [Candidatus Eisenbacteria bacterium]
MIRMSRLCVVLACMVASLALSLWTLNVSALTVHDPNVVARIVEIGTTHNQAMKHLDHLCRNIGPRPAGTKAHQEACEWAARRLKEFGLTNVHLKECGAIPAGAYERGASRFFKRLSRTLTFRNPDGRPVPIYNVVADIPGAERPEGK